MISKMPMNLKSGKREALIWSLTFVAFCLTAVAVQPLNKEEGDVKAIENIKLSEAYQNRAPIARKKALKAYRAEHGYECIVKALNWLAEVQNPYGSWGEQNQDGITSLALLSFLTHADAYNSEQYGLTVKKAIKWLGDQPVNEFSRNGYEHAIKTLALCEINALTGLLKPEMNKAVTVLVERQQEGGAYNYCYNTDEVRQDLSFSAWNYQALQAAVNADCKVKGINKAIKKSISWLSKNTAGRNEFSYFTRLNKFKPAATTHTMRAAGTYCLQLLNGRNHIELKDDIELISSIDLGHVSWERAPKISLYGWYFATNAMFLEGGDKWFKWNSKIIKEIKNGQLKSGAWEYPSKSYGDTLGGVSKKVYSSSLCILMLSSSFRYKK